VNWISIIVAAVVANLIGYGWYSSWAFGKSWQTLSGHTMGGGAGMGPLMGLTVVGSLVEAIAMSWFVTQTRVTSGASGALVGLFIGLGFIAPAMLADAIYTGRHPRLAAIVGGYQVVVAIVMGAIIGYWP
jgi:hypothetical protein